MPIIASFGGSSARGFGQRGVSRSIITGGVLTTTGGFNYYTFASSGTLSVLGAPATLEYIVVSGGGGGAKTQTSTNKFGTNYYVNGGGGAGGANWGTQLFAPGNYTIVVGGGGAGGVTGASGSDGSGSSLGSIATIGGGGGGANLSAGRNGGCGGGASGYLTISGTWTQGAIGLGSAGNGSFPPDNRGGNGALATWPGGMPMGGGGGGVSQHGGNWIGGAGVYWGTATYGTGGSADESQVAGGANTGNGGSTGPNSAGSGASGGGGVVILRVAA